MIRIYGLDILKTIAILSVVLKISLSGVVFSQENKFPFIEEFHIALNSSISSSFNNKLGCNLGVFFKPMKKANFSVIYGIEYLNSSILIENNTTRKHSSIKNGMYKFHFISNSLILRHDLFQKKLYFECVGKLDYDMASTHKFLNERNKLNLFVLPSAQIGIGHKVTIGNNNLLISIGTNLTTKIREDLVNTSALRYSTIYFYLGYVLKRRNASNRLK